MIPQGGESCFGGFFYWLPGVSIIRGDWLAGYHIPGRLKNQIMRRILNQYQKYFNPLSVDQVGSNYEKTVGRKSHWAVPLICNLKVVFYYIFWTKISNSVSGLLIFLLKSGPANPPPPPPRPTQAYQVSALCKCFLSFVVYLECCQRNLWALCSTRVLTRNDNDQKWTLYTVFTSILGFHPYFFFRNHLYN